MSTNKNKKHPLRSPQPVRRLRLRGDWSDTGPDARPEREGGRRSGTEIAQARPVLHTSLMQRMTDVLSRMLNDPATRAALNGGGEDNLEGWIIDQQGEGQPSAEEAAGDASTQSNEPSTAAQQTMDVEHNSGGASESGEGSLAAVSSQPSESTNALAVGNSTDNGIDGSGIEDSAEPFRESEEESAAGASPLPESETEERRLDAELDNVPMESESSQPESSKTSIQSFTSLSISREEEGRERSRNDDGPAAASLESAREGNIMENLQDRLTTMRDGFLERHGSEPAVSLTYSDKSSTGATISLGVANEVIRDSYHPGKSFVFYQHGHCIENSFSNFFSSQDRLEVKIREFSEVPDQAAVVTNNQITAIFTSVSIFPLDSLAVQRERRISLIDLVDFF